MAVAAEAAAVAEVIAAHFRGDEAEEGAEETVVVEEMGDTAEDAVMEGSVEAEVTAAPVEAVVMEASEAAGVKDTGAADAAGVEAGTRPISRPMRGMPPI